MRQYSVVIPAYNCEDTIIDAIQSVENQTRYDLVKEIMIVNDGSKDKTEPTVNEYMRTHPNHKVILVNKENGGAASARNMGIKKASCDYIALLDSDDEWLPNKLEIQNEIMDNHPEIKALGTNRSGENIHYGTQVEDQLYKLSCFQYCVKTWPCTPSIVFDRRCFKQSAFDASFTHAEEGLFFLYLAHEVGLYYVSLELVYCGRGKESYGVSGLSGNLKKMHQGVLLMQKEAYKKGYIGFFQYVFVHVLERVKYVRRKMIVKARG